MVSSARPFDEIPEVSVPAEARKNPVAYLLRAAISAGPIFRRRTPPRQVSRYGPWQVYLVGPEANRFVLLTQRTAFSHAQGWRAFFGGVWNDNLLYLDHAEHARQRRLMQPAFALAAVERHLPHTQRIVALHTRDWAERGIVEVRLAMRDLAFDVVAEVLLGLPPGEPIRELHRLRDALCRNPHPYGRERYWQHIQQARAALNACLLDLIERQAHLDDLPAILLHARDGGELSDDYLLGHLQVMLEAGHTTTMDTATWVLGLLAAHPAMMRDAQSEVDTVLRDGAPLTLAKLNQMHLLGAIINEAARLRTPVDTAPRVAEQTVEFAGYTIPAGTFVRLHLGACHRLPAVFSNPDSFEPSRFEPPHVDATRSPYAFAPFGGGPRLCIGMSFALAEVKVLAAHVLSRFDIAAIRGVAPANVFDVSDCDDSLPAGLPLRVTPRII